MPIRTTVKSKTFRNQGNKLKAIIFDFDGVLVESVGIKTEAFRELFKEYPEYLKAIVKLHLEHGGLSRFKKFAMIYEKILKINITKKESHRLGKLFSRYVFKKIIECSLVEGALNLLKRYHKKIDMFIVSGTPQSEIKAIVKHKGLKKYFKEILGSPKSKKELIAYLIKKYGYPCNLVILVGDSKEDFEGASCNGIRYIARCCKKNLMKEKSEGLAVSDLRDLQEQLCKKGYL